MTREEKKADAVRFLGGGTPEQKQAAEEYLNNTDQNILFYRLKKNLAPSGNERVSKFMAWWGDRLGELPALVDDILCKVPPVVTTRFSDVAPGGEAERLPFNVDAMVDADLIYSNLVILALDVYERAGGVMPDGLRKSWDTSEPQGLRAGLGRVEVWRLTKGITDYLSLNSSELEKRDYADSVAHVANLIKSMQRKYGFRGSERFLPRKCPVCGLVRVQVFWSHRLQDLPVVKCKFCGWKLPKDKAVDEWLGVIGQLAEQG